MRRISKSYLSGCRGWEDIRAGSLWVTRCRRSETPTAPSDCHQLTERRPDHAQEPIAMTAFAFEPSSSSISVAGDLPSQLHVDPLLLGWDGALDHQEVFARWC